MDISNMNISDIRSVVSVFQEKSFTRAAKKLFITQSAVSQSIARLEKSLGLLLFIRTGTSVVPAPACYSFVNTGQEILRLYEKLKQDMSQTAIHARTCLRIGTASFFFKFLTYQNDIIKRHDHLDFDLTVVEDDALAIEDMVLNGQVDFCFTRMPLQHRTLEYEPLFMETIMLAVPVSHPVCSKYPIPTKGSFTSINLKDLADEDFVIVNNPRIIPLCLKMCEEAGFTPRVTSRPKSWEHVYACIEAGAGAGFISCLHMNRDEFTQSLRFFCIDSPNSCLMHAVGYASRTNLSPHAEQYIKALREQILMWLPV